VIFISYYIYNFYYIPRKQKDLGLLVRILLFEQVGNDKLFRGYRTAYESTDDKIGVYIMIKSLKKAISQISSTDFFPDKEFNKCLMVCKYSDDDYRSMSRMKDQEWYRKIELSPLDYLETEQIEGKEGEQLTQLKLDKNGETIQKLDKDKNPLPNYTLQSYDEPIGVNQTSREAMRFNRAFSKRMQEKRQEKGTFWDKYGQYVFTATIVLIMFMSMAYSNNKMADTVTYALDKFGEEADKISSSVQSESFVQGLLDKIEKKDIEQQAPNK